MPADTVVVGDSSAVLCAETPGAPVELRAVEPSIGGLEVGIIGAFACELTEAGAFEELKTARPRMTVAPRQTRGGPLRAAADARR